MIETILVPTDGSEAAGKAVRFAADLASKYGAQVILLHVLLRRHLSEGLRHMVEVEHLPAEGGQSLTAAVASIPEARFPVSMVPVSAGPSEGEVLRATAERILQTAARVVKDHGAGDAAMLIEDGDAAKRIIEISKSRNVDLIVMGSRGFSDIEGLFLGSVSHKVTHYAPCTCMTVR